MTATVVIGQVTLTLIILSLPFMVAVGGVKVVGWWCWGGGGVLSQTGSFPPGCSSSARDGGRRRGLTQVNSGLTHSLNTPGRRSQITV